VQVSPRTLLRAVAANRPFRLLLIANVVQQAGVGALLSVIPYVAVYGLGGTQGVVTIIFLCFVGPAIAGMPLWVAIGRRIGKRRGYATSLIAYGIACLPLGLVPPDAPGLLYAGIAVAGIAYAGTQIFPFSMLPDTMHAGQARSGVAQEGVLAGIFTASEKIGMAVGPLLTGLVLAVSGFVESTAGTPSPQPESAITGIRFAGSVLPAVLILSSALALRTYALDP
jgi:Na+/melibiose symporter-like transporter